MLDSGSTVVNVKEIPITPQIQKQIDNKKIVAIEKNGERYIIDVETMNREKWLAEFFKEHVTAFPPIPYDNRIPALIEQYESTHYKLADEQKSAVVMFLTQRLGVLTGGPGTGKTTVLDCALYVILELQKLNGKINVWDIKLLSPTGKAARRMYEATQMGTSTVLKSLKFNPITKKPTQFIGNSIIFIDESSMLDTETMYWLARNIRPDCRLYLIGDTEQLPSVGPGSILRDLIDCPLIPRVQLKKTFRQAEGSSLFKNIQIVRDGYKENFVEGTDFLTFEKYSEFLPLYLSEVKKRGKENVCVLTPTRKSGIYCSEKLNHRIQVELNGNEGVKVKVKRDNRDLIIPFRVGDPVMQLTNREIANGEVGVVIGVNPVTVRYADTTIKYSARELWQLDLAYAISIHKSQGSEYQCVFVLCTEEGSLDRNMIYTAITRAKKQCYVFGTNEVIRKACQIQTSKDRKTCLSIFLNK